MATNVINTSNMNLPVPIATQDPGPDYALNINACLGIIDSHNHANGSGVAITPNGMNINIDLPFNGSSATMLLTAAFQSQISALVGTNFLSFIGGNLYVNDGSGNQIPITSGGGVAGTPGSIGSLTSPASASYSSGSKTFIWQSGSSKSAAMDNGAITIHETDVASAKGITLQSPTSLGANYGLTLPTGLPAATDYLSCDSGGNLAFVTANAIASAMTVTGADAIASTMDATGANTIAASRTRASGTPTEGVGGICTATSTDFTTTSATPVSVTNASVTLTTSGRPIMLVIGSGISGFGFFAIQPSNSAVRYGGLVTVLNSTNTSQVGSFAYGAQVATASAGVIVNYQVPASFSCIDYQAAGTYTYIVQLAGFAKTSTNTNTTFTAEASFITLMAYEL